MAGKLKQEEMREVGKLDEEVEKEQEAKVGSAQVETPVAVKREEMEAEYVERLVVEKLRQVEEEIERVAKLREVEEIEWAVENLRQVEEIEWPVENLRRVEEIEGAVEKLRPVERTEGAEMMEWRKVAGY